MSFQLNIEFAGMCLLVHDTETGGGRLQVLLPPTGTDGSGHGGHTAPTDETSNGADMIPLHVARLVYHAAYEQLDSASDHEVRKVALDGISLDLSGVASNSDFRADMPREVVNLADVTSNPVSRSLFQGNGGGRLVSRITMAHGAVSWRHGGGIFQFPSNSPRRMAIAVRWTLEIDSDSLNLKLASFDGSSQDRSLELFPGPDRKLHLYVFHSPEDEIPGSLPPRYAQSNPPKKGEAATHFRAYYDLTDGVEDPAPVPSYAGESEGAKAEGGTKGILGLHLTCMTATATV